MTLPPVSAESTPAFQRCVPTAPEQCPRGCVVLDLWFYFVGIFLRKRTKDLAPFLWWTTKDFLYLFIKSSHFHSQTQEIYKHTESWTYYFLSWHPIQFIKYLLITLCIQKHIRHTWDGPKNKTDPVLTFTPGYGPLSHPYYLVGRMGLREGNRDDVKNISGFLPENAFEYLIPFSRSCDLLICLDIMVGFFHFIFRSCVFKAPWAFLFNHWNTIFGLNRLKNLSWGEERIVKGKLYGLIIYFY